MQKRPAGVPDDHHYIPFTRYVRPHGGTREDGIYHKLQVQRTAIACITAGAKFGVEVLGGNKVGLYCQFRNDTIVTQIANNGPEMLYAVERLMIMSSEKILEVLQSEKHIDTKRALNMLEGKDDAP